MPPYNSTADADAYFAARYGYSKWTPLTSGQKTQALTSAQQELDLQCDWYGYPTDPDQTVAFPRDGETVVPDEVKAAECEIAYAIVDGGSASSEASDLLEQLSTRSVTLQFKVGGKKNPLVSEKTTKLLKPYGLCGGSGSTRLVPIMRQ
jgi:hypothetical protein